MNVDDKTRRALALIVVISWVSVLLLCLAMAALDGNPSRWMGVFQQFSSVASGIVGAIVGYYFGAERSGARTREPDPPATQGGA